MPTDVRPAYGSTDNTVEPRWLEVNALEAAVSRITLVLLLWDRGLLHDSAALCRNPRD